MPECQTTFDALGFAVSFIGLAVAIPLLLVGPVLLLAVAARIAGGGDDQG